MAPECSNCVLGRARTQETEERHARPASSLSIILSVTDHASFRWANRIKSVQCVEKDLRRRL
jgi:hypothetical protein